MAYLDYIRTMPLPDIEKRRAIINIFVHSVYLYDDHFTLVVNASSFPQKEKDIPLDDIEKAFENDEEADCGTCSAVNDAVPPYYLYEKDIEQKGAVALSPNKNKTGRSIRVARFAAFMYN